MSEVIVKKIGKETNKTDMFKVHIQKIVFQTLGVKISKEKAWELFKAIQHGTVEFVINIEGGSKKLPLAGVGTFEILETKPRGSKAGLDPQGNPIPGAEVWPCVPRFRFYPSVTIDNLVEHSYGLGNHNFKEEDIKHYGLFASEEVAEEPKTVKEVKASKAEVVEETTEVVEEGAEEFEEISFDDDIL